MKWVYLPADDAPKRGKGRRSKGVSRTILSEKKGESSKGKKDALPPAGRRERKKTTRGEYNI